MSEVISFRLDPNNPREAHALEILTTKKGEGFSSRKVLTDGLIGLESDIEQIDINEINTTLEHVQRLLESLTSGNHDQMQSMRLRPQVDSLKANFLDSVKIAIKPGLNLDEEKHSDEDEVEVPIISSKRDLN